MTSVALALRSSEEIAAGTMLFRFEKPPGFWFEAGQAVDLILPGSSAAQPLRHTFTIASAPFEDEIAFATRMRDSEYKRCLASLRPGKFAEVEGPFGLLTLHKEPTRGAVFIAGGIGITPFISMLRQAARDRVPRALSLIYSNRRPEDAAYLDELARIEKDNFGFRLVATMTDMSKSTRQWSGPTALVDMQLIEATARGIAKPIFYVVGPPAMVDSVRTMLHAVGALEDDVRTEEFFGY